MEGWHRGCPACLQGEISQARESGKASRTARYGRDVVLGEVRPGHSELGRAGRQCGRTKQEQVSNLANSLPSYGVQLRPEKPPGLVTGKTGGGLVRFTPWHLGRVVRGHRLSQGALLGDHCSNPGDS